jgi:hypothetical protein
VIVDGELTNGFQSGFEQFHIEVEAGETVIEGDFVDSAELSSTLCHLQDLGFGLIAASLVDDAPRHPTPYGSSPITDH